MLESRSKAQKTRFPMKTSAKHFDLVVWP